MTVMTAELVFDGRNAVGESPVWVAAEWQLAQFIAKMSWPNATWPAV